MLTTLAMFWTLTAAASGAPQADRIPDPPCFVRTADGTPIACPETDAGVVRNYWQWPAYGAWHRDARLSIGAATARVKVGEPLRVLHVMESRGAPELWLMGPKAIRGMLVDGRPFGDPGPSGDARSPEMSSDSPWVFGSYDGVVAPGPGLDSNFEISTLTFDSPGRHTIRWVLGPWRSNMLVVVVEPR